MALLGLLRPNFVALALRVSGVGPVIPAGSPMGGVGALHVDVEIVISDEMYFYSVTPVKSVAFEP